ncbi:MAG: mechanosensitive ion channel [Helicobacter sp.]|uniref:mechanosensitive ion channel domain-containing protein n=1 Tax=Helicobacter sp. 10-6591 TaxID=2004998 RepID=UPI00215CE028|nr:mechanosensitive ion channel domain-containing protein [Helicobacter sp. 10-6591]MCI6218270.1 mechanosensitive ion channel [Helicobacter sp.]MCI7484965.1 mechanosensitive ion channel [Helicobacter sp.]
MRLLALLVVFSVLTFAQDVLQVKDLQVKDLELKLKQIDKMLKQSNNIWLKQYENIKTYENLTQEIARIESKLKKTKDITQINQQKIALQTLKKQREFVEPYAQNPYFQLLETPVLTDIPQITNPILIVSGYSFIKHLDGYKSNMVHNEELLSLLIDTLKQYYDIAQTLFLHHKQNNPLEAKDYNTKVLETKRMIQSLESAQKILKTSNEIYFKNIEDIKNTLNREIKDQFFKMLFIAVAILAVFLFGFSLKIALRKYLEGNRVYTVNKVIDFSNITFVMIILLFAYLENVTYLVAIVGFASAGLAIAMKDLFMSVLGWFVIVFGGSVHVGDRIRVLKDGALYVGDVLDISVLRMTIYEDLTLTTYMQNRRAGRIIFIPNNYIFTTLLANYTHAGLKTIWDGIDFTITFDSNYKKALKLATEIGRKYSKGYTEVTRKRMERLKNRFSVRNMNLETRAFSMLEPNGIRISLWYQANSYAAISLRSTISAEIIEAILKEDDIYIAYPTTKIIPTGSDGAGNKVSYHQASHTGNNEAGNKNQWS